MNRLSRSIAAPFALLAALAGAPVLAEPVATPAPAVAEAPQQAAEKPTHPALWKVADADTTIYLFGTIHLLPEGIEWYAGPVAEAFEKADLLVTEIPETPDNESAVMLLKHGTLPAGQTLRGLMNDAERASFDAAMTRVGMPVNAFDRYKPWFAAVVLATLPLQREGFNLSNGVENQLDTRNKALQRERIGLETLDYQLSIFNGFPVEVQKRYLFEVIKAEPTIKEDVAKMIAAWAKGEAAELATMLNAEEEDPAMYQALLTNRNKAWAQWIAKRLDEPGTVFIAVGAGHLGGKDSVQDILATSGHSTQRVQ